MLLPIGELDEYAVDAFEDAVGGLVGRGRPIVLDLDRLTFIDSCGLWSVSSVCSACRQRGIGIRLWPGPANVQKVFEVTGLYDLLPFTACRPAEAG